MKKKGLIVATIVMVLVLAVSLTTATYAWFTASASAVKQTKGVYTLSASNLSPFPVVPATSPFLFILFCQDSTSGTDTQCGYRHYPWRIYLIESS